MPPFRAAVVTVSDSVAGGAREDLSGPAVARLLQEAGWVIQSTEVLPDEFSLLRERLEALASFKDLDAVFTTGGTGIGPRDRTPEATTSVMERSLPGLAEMMRREGLKKTPLAALSRAVVGVKGKTLLINLPGAPDGARDSLAAILGILAHAVQVVRGEAAHGQAPRETTAPAPTAAAEEESAPPEALPAEEPAGEADAAREAGPEQDNLGKEDSL